MKLTDRQYEKLAEGGSRRLFDFEGYRLLDTMDAEDNQSYIMINYDEDEFYSISLQEAYGLLALYVTAQNGEILEVAIAEAIEQVLKKHKE
ncbi:hypothetical protein [Ammoniphilus sp. YIM 78166]|uniref:hypothetical protein n=1 Tax=Ammoniphilus sp. YIM 78166 TaxID=1644106 RepID=UPI00106F7023|nr:hypothetical protein [Ammoniphilus sp. YIM 78166]